MARFRIAYLDGEDEIVTANEIEPIGGLYVAHGDKHAVAYIPDGNVRSIVRLDEMDAGTYPRPDGDVTVLGPEIFASKDGSVICWKGENYTRQSP